MKQPLHLALSVAAIAGLMAGCARPPEEAASTPVILEGQQVVALGRIEPEGEVISVSVSNAADSRVNELRVAEGDIVAAGEVIAVLQGIKRRQADLEASQALVRQRQAELAQQRRGGVEPATIAAKEATLQRLQAQLSTQTQQRQAAIDRAQAELQEAEANYRRYVALTAAGAESRAQLEVAQRGYDTAQAQLAERQASLAETTTTLQAQLAEEQARLRELQEVPEDEVAIATARLEQAQMQVAQDQAALDDVLVRAPVAGQILRIHTRVGEKVNTEQGIVELAQTDQMMVVAEVYETDIRRVSLGQQAEISSEYGGITTELTGTVEQVGLQIGTASFNDTDTNPTQDVNARVVTVKIRLDAASSQRVTALTGMQVRVAIDT